MCLFQVSVLLGTNIVIKMHFSSHVPGGGLSVLLSPPQEVFYKYPGSSRSLLGPALPALLVLCTHAVLQLWPRGVHRGQGTPKYTVPWSKNAQMPANPPGLAPYLGECWPLRAQGQQPCSRDYNQENHFQAPAGT